MPFDRPTKNELLSAVREFMEDKLLPELKGHVNFNTRVAINVLKTLERELQLGDGISAEAHQRLLSLLQNQDQELGNRELNNLLSKQINNRKLGYQDQQLIDHLWQTSMDKLSVDNPKYASYQEELTRQ